MIMQKKWISGKSKIKNLAYNLYKSLAMRTASHVLHVYVLTSMPQTTNRDIRKIPKDINWRVSSQANCIYTQELST